MSYFAQLSKQQIAWLIAAVIAACGIVGIGLALEGDRGRPKAAQHDAFLS